jgi:branched-chain amino acid transport system substrate-binding protein
LKRIALMFSTDASGQDAEQGLKSIFALPENKEMAVVETAHFNTTDVSVSAQIEGVKAAQPQAFIAWSTGTPIGTIFRAIEQAALDIPIATTDGNMTHAQMTQYAAFLPKEIYFTTAPWVIRDAAQLPPAVAEKNREFYRAFDAIGVKPDLPTGLAWDPPMILVNALRTLGPDASATQVRDYMIHLKNYAGLNGIYDFEKTPQRGIDVTNAVVTRWSAAEQSWKVVSQAGGAPLP